MLLIQFWFGKKLIVLAKYAAFSSFRIKGVAWILKIVVIFKNYNFHNESVQDQKHAEY